MESHIRRNSYTRRKDQYTEKGLDDLSVHCNNRLSTPDQI